jgi:hypothetical protein
MMAKGRVSNESASSRRFALAFPVAHSGSLREGIRRFPPFSARLFQVQVNVLFNLDSANPEKKILDRSDRHLFHITPLNSIKHTQNSLEISTNFNRFPSKPRSVAPKMVQPAARAPRSCLVPGAPGLASETGDRTPLNLLP